MRTNINFIHIHKHELHPQTNIKQMKIWPPPPSSSLPDPADAPPSCGCATSTAIAATETGWRERHDATLSTTPCASQGHRTRSVDGNGVPDLPSSRENYQFGGNLTHYRASDQHYPNPIIAAPRLLWLSTMSKPIDLVAANWKHKQEQERLQHKCRWLINNSKLGFHKSMNDETGMV